MMQLITYIVLFICCLSTFSSNYYGVFVNASPLCSDLGIQVNLTILENAAQIDDYSLTYASKDNQIIFIRTIQGDVYRSGDEGESWEKQSVNTKMAGIEQTVWKVGQIVTTHEEVPGVTKLYLLGSTSTQDPIQYLWVTEDGGNTYQIRSLPTNIGTTIRVILLAHPKRQNVALLYTLESNVRIFKTEDFAQSWVQLPNFFAYTYPPSVQWAVSDQYPDRMYAIRRTPNELTTSWNQQLIRTDNYAANSLVILDHVAEFYLAPDSVLDLIAVQWIAPDSNRYNLVLTNNGGSSWQIPTWEEDGLVQKDEYSFYIYDQDPRSLMVGAVRVGTYGIAYAFTDLYMGNGYNDTNWSLSLRWNRLYDFSRYLSLDGIYVTNQYVPTNPNVGISPGDDIRTMITYNGGGKWQLLNPPVKKFDGTDYNCNITNGCSLHLHGSGSTPYTWFYSSPSAVGLMLASGNVGNELSNDATKINTYFSKDAGVTWTEVAKGPYIPEFGDSGGLVILGNAVLSTNEILYSDDEGNSWKYCTFSSDKNITVTNIRVSPKFNSKEFVMHGRWTNTSNGVISPAIVALDFKNTMPNCTANDYEEWTPTNSTGVCVLGEKIVYLRRKPGVRCFNGENYQVIQKTEICDCVKTDYECGFCYEYNAAMDTCVFTCWNDATEAAKLPDPSTQAECNSGGTYFTISNGQGWRKVEGDKCNSTAVGATTLTSLTSKVPCAKPAPPPTNPPPVTPPTSPSHPPPPPDGVHSCAYYNIQVNQTILPLTSAIDDYQITYVTEDNQVILIRTAGGDIYRSTNEGESWVLQTVPAKMQGIDTTDGKIWWIYQTVANQQGMTKIYLSSVPGPNQKIWFSSDGGNTYQLRAAPARIEDLIPNPYDNSKSLAVLNTGSLWYSSNDGLSWTMIHSRIYSVASLNWGFKNEVATRIYCIIIEDDENTANFYSQALIYTDNFFQTHTILRRHVGSFFLRNADDILAVQYVDENSPGRIALVFSADAGLTWKMGTFPNNGVLETEELAWTMYDTSTESIMTNVWRSFAFGSSWGDIYKANGYDKGFSLSLKYHAPPDFAKFDSVEGIYIANVWNTTNTASGPQPTNTRYTMITYNKGGKWQLLNAPSKKWDGSDYTCKASHSCSLHLHGVTGAPFTWFYSVPNAIGLMLATGNVGRSLNLSPAETNTYFSNDAGVTWEEIRKGSYVPEFGDKGGLMVMAHADEKTSHIVFSVDQGLTWQECSVTNGNSIDVSNIRVSPGWDSKEFLLYGDTTIGDATTKYPTIVALDFKDVMLPCNANDYEEWTPTDANGNCVLGEQITYKRRKRGSKCFNGENWESIVSRSTCACVVSDFECDHCFKMDPILDKCVFDCYNVPSELAKLEKPGPGECNSSNPVHNDYYEIIAGWRKVESDKCDESKPASIQLSSLYGIVPCVPPEDPPVPFSSNQGGSHLVLSVSLIVIIVVIVVLVVVLVILGVYIGYTRNDKFRQCLGGPPLANNYGNLRENEDDL